MKQFQWADGCHDAGRFVGRCQNRVRVGPDISGEIGGAAPGDNSDAALAELTAFFTAAQIISREKGFSRNSDIPSFSALNATALGS
jgi:hypothetical protein